MIEDDGLKRVIVFVSLIAISLISLSLFIWWFYYTLIKTDNSVYFFAPLLIAWGCLRLPKGYKGIISRSYIINIGGRYKAIHRVTSGTEAVKLGYIDMSFSLLIIIIGGGLLSAYS